MIRCMVNKYYLIKYDLFSSDVRVDNSLQVRRVD